MSRLYGHQMYPERISSTVDIPDKSLGMVLDETANLYGHRTAMWFAGQTWTYSNLRDEARAFGTALQHAGVAKGDRVALMLPNCPEFVIAYYGTLMVGGIVALYNPMSVAREIVELVDDTQPKVLVTMDTIVERLDVSRLDDTLKQVVFVRCDGTASGSLSEESSIQFTFFEAFVDDARNFALAPVDISPETDVATLQYTGGTTGKSKAAMLTHRNLLANVVQSAEFYQDMYHPGNDICLAVLPLFHAFGMTLCMNVSIFFGAKMLLLPKFDVGHVAETIRDERPNIFPGVPTMYTALIHFPDIEQYGLDSIRMCITGGGPMPLEVLRTFEEKAGCKVLEGYGLSETSPITHCNPPFAERKAGTVGVLFPSTECKIVGLDESSELSPGGPGELVVRGPQVMKGYWRMSEETATALRDGWFYTGDIARMDADGYVSIVDRKKDMIIASGFKVYPREIEDVLYGHPAVREALVVGVSDDYRGETVKACIVLKAKTSVTEEEIKAYCKANLAPYKVPTAIEFRDELPKSAVGKLLRRALRD